MDNFCDEIKNKRMLQAKKNKMMQKLMLIAVLMTGLSFFGASRAMATGGFSQSCGDIKIDGPTLSANCKTSSGGILATTLNLNSFIGNLDGVLSWGDKDFSQSCRNTKVDRAKLSAECQKMDGSYISSGIDLDAQIANIEGTLKFEGVIALGQFSQSCDDIKIDGPFLSANCRTSSGGFRATTINLDSHIGNLDGVLSWGDEDFSQTCRSITVDRSKLSAECETIDGRYISSEIDLDAHVANTEGTLTIKLLE